MEGEKLQVETYINHLCRQRCDVSLFVVCCLFILMWSQIEQVMVMTEATGSDYGESKV